MNYKFQAFQRQNVVLSFSCNLSEDLLFDDKIKSKMLMYIQMKTWISWNFLEDLYIVIS